MTVEQFTQTVDGIINDYRDGLINEIEFRDNITDLLISITTPILAQDTEEEFTSLCDALSENAENSPLFRKALLRVTAQIIYDLHGEEYEDAANALLSIVQEEY